MILKVMYSSVIPLLLLLHDATADYLSDPDLNRIFESNGPGRFQSLLPRHGSCCQYDVCGLQCREMVQEHTKGMYVGGILHYCYYFDIHDITNMLLGLLPHLQAMLSVRSLLLYCSSWSERAYIS